MSNDEGDVGMVLAALDFPGNAEELKSCYDEALRRMVDISPARPVLHIAVPRDYGLMICDVWDSEEALQKFRENPDVIEAIRVSGLPDPTYRIFDIHNVGWPVSISPMYR